MRLAITTTITALALLGASRANAFDLTGNWVGKWSCSHFDGGVKQKRVNTESTLAVTSLGNDTFGARIDGSIAYRGIEIPDAKKPDDKGEVAIVHCGSDDDPAAVTANNFFEAGRWKVAVKNAKGTLSGITIYSFSASHIATCKYKYKRVDTTDPNLNYACPL